MTFLWRLHHNSDFETWSDSLCDSQLLIRWTNSNRSNGENMTTYLIKYMIKTSANNNQQLNTRVRTYMAAGANGNVVRCSCITGGCGMGFVEWTQIVKHPEPSNIHFRPRDLHDHFKHLYIPRLVYLRTHTHTRTDTLSRKCQNLKHVHQFSSYEKVRIEHRLQLGNFWRERQ